MVDLVVDPLFSPSSKEILERQNRIEFVPTFSEQIFLGGKAGISSSLSMRGYDLVESKQRDRGNKITAKEANKRFPMESPYIDDVFEGDAQFAFERSQKLQEIAFALKNSPFQISIPGMGKQGLVPLVSGLTAGFVVDIPLTLAVGGGLGLAAKGLHSIFKGSRLLNLANRSSQFIRGGLTSGSIPKGFAAGALTEIATSPVFIAGETLLGSSAALNDPYTSQDLIADILFDGMMGGLLGAASSYSSRRLRSSSSEGGKNSIGNSLLQADLGKDGNIGVQLNARARDTHRIRPGQSPKEFKTMSVIEAADTVFYGASNNTSPKIRQKGNIPIDSRLANAIMFSDNHNKAFNTAASVIDDTSGVVIGVKLKDANILDIDEALPLDIQNTLRPILEERFGKEDVDKLFGEGMTGFQTLDEIDRLSGLEEDGNFPALVTNAIRESGIDGFKFSDGARKADGSFDINTRHNALALLNPEKAEIVQFDKAEITDRLDQKKFREMIDEEERARLDSPQSDMDYDEKLYKQWEELPPLPEQDADVSTIKQEADEVAETLEQAGKAVPVSENPEMATKAAKALASCWRKKGGF